MHRCLQIYEILELIFNAVFHQTQNRKPVVDRLSILAVLTTCRSFSGHAMKLLWKDLETLGPLLLTMPDDLIKVEKDRWSPFVAEHRLVTFQREVLPSDWERFDFYAPLVKTLGIGSLLPSIILDCRVEEELSKRVSPLLPNLTMLEDTSGNPYLMRRLLASRIHWLDLKLDPTYGALPTYQLIADLPTLTPLLKSLYLSRNDTRTWEQSEVDLVSPALVVLLENLKLKVFECEWFQLTADNFKKLVQMTRLRRIAIFFDLLELEAMLDLFPFTKPMLKDVYIWTESDTPSQLPQILASLMPSVLESFHVQQDSIATMHFSQEDLEGLVSAIVNHCSPKYLKCFNIIDCKPMWQPFPPAVADAKLFRPLYVFSNLQELSLAVHPDFTDAEVKELAMSWPLLEELHIETLPPPLPPRTTLRCILWFAIYCRKLRELSFSFKGIDTFTKSELGMAAKNPLKCFSVGCSTIEEAEITKFTKFVKIVFPSLKCIVRDNYGDDDEHVDVKFWDKVDKIVCNRA